MVPFMVELEIIHLSRKDKAVFLQLPPTPWGRTKSQVPRAE